MQAQSCPSCGSAEVVKPLEDPEGPRRFADAMLHALNERGGFSASPADLPTRCRDCRHEWLDEPEDDIEPDGDDATLWRCGLYFAGHDVHWIQALNAANGRHTRPVKATVVDIDTDGVDIVLKTACRGVLRYRNHDTPRLASLLDEWGTDVVLHRNWSLLMVRGDGWSCISIASASERWREC